MNHTSTNADLNSKIHGILLVPKLTREAATLCLLRKQVCAAVSVLLLLTVSAAVGRAQIRNSSHPESRSSVNFKTEGGKGGYASQQAAASEINFCRFDLPEVIKQAHASFSLIYYFQVDERGRVVRIHQVTDNYVGEEKVSACLSHWRLRDVAKDVNVLMVQRWEHGMGWVSLSIAGADFSRVIRLTDVTEIGAASVPSVGGDEHKSPKRTLADVFLDVPLSPMRVLISGNKRDLLLSNRFPRTVVRYRFGCVLGDNDLRLLRTFSFVGSNLGPGEVLLNSLSKYEKQAKICSQRQAKLAIAELVFQDGTTWRISAIHASENSTAAKTSPKVAER